MAKNYLDEAYCFIIDRLVLVPVIPFASRSLLDVVDSIHAILHMLVVTNVPLAFTKR